MPENNQRYPANNHKSKEIASEPDRKPMARVTKGDAKLKKPFRRRVMETFVGGDIETVGPYILFEVVIPSIREMVVNSGKEALERAFFGTTAPRPRGGGPTFSYGSNNRTSYSGRYNGRTEEVREERRGRSPVGYEEIILPTASDAHEVLDAMHIAIQEFDSVSVADVYDLIGQSHDYMDRSWGWNSIKGAEVRRLRSDEFLLDLPRPERLN